MENDAEQLKNRFVATSRPSNLSETDCHGSQAVISKEVIPRIRIDTNTGTIVGFLDYESSTYSDDGSTSTEKMFIVPNSCGSDAAKSKARKGEIYLSFLDSENNICHVDVSTTEDEILMVADSCGSPAVKSKADKEEILTVTDSHGSQAVTSKTVISEAWKGELDSHGSPAAILKEAISKDWEDGPYPRNHMGFLDFESRDDGPTTEEAISLLDDPSVSPTVIPMSGKGVTYVHSLDSERNTHQDDGSTASAAVLDTSTTTTGGSKVLIPEGSQEGEAQQASMESLPADIVQDILSRVPAEFVLECKLVSKKWATLIRGSNFAKMHLTHQLKHLHGNIAADVEPCLFFACRIDKGYKTLLFHGGQPSDGIRVDGKYIYNQNLKRIYHAPMHDEPLTDHIVGSCNGLVCAFQSHQLIMDPIYICNPLTREYVYLPELSLNKEDVDPELIEEGEVDMCNRIACGFGYVRSTNEYKVVRIHYLEYMKGTVEVYTLGSGCGWRAVGEVPYPLNASCGGRGTYANDAIYWTSYNKVAAFDLAKEEFRMLSVPSRMENRRLKDVCGLVALGRHLCLYIDDKLRVQMWRLTESSDSKEIGCMEFDIDYEALVSCHYRNLRPILLTKKGEIIFLFDESVLYCYDPKTTVLKMISNEASTDHFEAVDAIAHVNTLASLEAMGENSKRYTVRTQLDDVIDELDRVALGEEIDSTCFRFRS